MEQKRTWRNLSFDAATKKFILKFSFDREMKDALKAAFPFKNRNWNEQKFQWEISGTEVKGVAAFAAKWDFTVGDSAKRLLATLQKPVYEKIELPNLTIDIPLKKPMFPFQAQGVAYNIEHQNSVLIGDDMGLGKSVQAIATMVGLKLKTVLVICPAHLMNNWLDEVHMWTNLRAARLDSKIAARPAQWFGTGFLHFCVINYESLPKYFAQDLIRDDDNKVVQVVPNGLKDYFEGVIIDESHQCSNEKTQRWLTANEICEGKKKVLCLSGTPLNNKVSEFAAQLKLMRVMHHFGGERSFYAKYGKINHGNSTHSEFVDLLEELKYTLRKVCYYRREKHEVLAELPDKFRQVINVPLTNMREYLQAEEDLWNYMDRNIGKTQAEIEKAMRAEFMVKIGILKQISARGKVKAAIEFIRDVVEQGQKIVVFCHHRIIIEELHKAFPDAVTITGGMSPDDKHNNKNAFQQKPEVMIILCSIEAANTGLTLTASSTVLFVEQPWTATKTDQCEDRCHRIGAKDTVNAYYLLGEHTVDEKIFRLIQDKRQLFQAVTGAEDVVQTTAMSALFNEMFNKKKTPALA